MTDTLPPGDQPQPLIAHLIELRNRLLRAVLAVLVVFLALFAFAQDLYGLVARPLMDVLPEGTSMIATEVTGPFLVPFKLAFYASLVLAMPVILFQVWSFIAPGLYSHEKKFGIPLLASSVVLFYSGAAFAYFVVFPLLFSFFTSVAPEGVAVMTDIGSYLDFVSTLFIAFGLAFELPVALVLLVWAGLVERETLKTARPYVFVGCFIIGMMLTPPDVFSQTLLAVPMWLLYEVGLVVSRYVTPRTDRGL